MYDEFCAAHNLDPVVHFYCMLRNLLNLLVSANQIAFSSWYSQYHSAYSRENAERWKKRNMTTVLLLTFKYKTKRKSPPINFAWRSWIQFNSEIGYILCENSALFDGVFRDLYIKLDVPNRLNEWRSLECNKNTTLRTAHFIQFKAVKWRCKHIRYATTNYSLAYCKTYSKSARFFGWSFHIVQTRKGLVENSSEYFILSIEYTVPHIMYITPHSEYDGLTVLSDE